MRNKLIFKFGFCLLKRKTSLRVGKEIQANTQALYATRRAKA